MKFIKSIISLSVVVMLLGISGSAFAVNDPTFKTWIVKRQTGTQQGDPVRVIKLVRFSSRAVNGPDIASGDVLVYDTVSDDGVTVRLTTTSADGAVAGISCVAIQTSDAITGTSAQDDAGRRNWGYMVVHGPADAKAAAGGTNGNAAGDLFLTSTDSGAITTLQTPTGTGTVQSSELRKVVNGRGGVILDAADGTSTVYKVFVELE